MRESLIEKHFVKRVKEAGGETRKVKWIARRNAPDRVAMFPPSSGFPPIVWPELKATKKEARAAQAREHERMRKMGQIVLIFNSIEAIDEWFGVTK